ncbi:uncharacterized protein METZ01_LOCUS213047, partial [marine metagenome]
VTIDSDVIVMLDDKPLALKNSVILLRVNNEYNLNQQPCKLYHFKFKDFTPIILC